MIRMIQSTSANHAKAYFSDALSKSDYYLNDQELPGRFNGRVAERLNLTGAASKEAFFALCENLNPNTGQPLTPRTKEERTTGYDINYHCPKSVSAIHALANDNHILDMFEESVDETNKDIEADAQTRVRKDGAYEDRVTGELIWADFTHQTARPVDDRPPDFHLHRHSFFFNVTWDDQEKRYKAAKFRDIKRDMPYYQARFHKRLSDKLIAAGYRIKRTEKSFEIEGVPERVIKHFSKRTDEIGRVAKEKGITDAKGLDALGARTRSKKQKGYTMDELKAEWKKQIHDLGPDEKGESDNPVRYGRETSFNRASPGRCVDHAVQHSFERASVMADRRILQSAYRFAVGNRSVSIDDITREFNRDDRIIRVSEKGRLLCTTKEVLQEEKQMVELARKGKGQITPLYKKAPALKVKGQAADALDHILTTANRVSIIRGAAGAGKTTLMREAREHVQNAGINLVAVAPTAEAANVLKDEGFKQAETVARLLVDKKLQDDLEGQALFMDEGGLLGTKDMLAVLELVTRKNARLILVGDTRQHASVVRGDALRILNTVGGIRTAEVSKIYRQQNEQYRAAVEDLSKGQVKDAFDKLDDMGAIKNIDPLNPHEDLVNDYIKTVKKGKTALVISPTHKQGDEVTEAIRTRLRKAGMIGKKEIQVTKLQNLNLTEAEKTDWRNFQKGQVIQFNQNAKGIKRGSRWSVDSSTEKEVLLKNEQGRSVALPRETANRYDVYQRTELALSKGDKIRITHPGFDNQDKRLNNGSTLEVMAVTKKGHIRLRNKESKATYILDQDFGHLAHAHVITSYSSQGKTVDETFIAQPASTFGATDAKQFYVSVSRGKHAVHIYTDDKVALLDHASEMGDRQSAMELVGQTDHHMDHVLQRERAGYDIRRPFQKTKKEIVRNKPSKDRDYEPGL